MEKERAKSLTANPPTVLVTGASQGIGRAISLELARGGQSVLGVSRTKPEEHRDSDGFANLTWKSLDLADAVEIGAFVSGLEAPSMRVLVLSAVDYGVNRRHPAVTTSPAEWQRVVSTNCIGQCVLVSQLLPTLLRNPPAIIINISSDVAIFPAPGRAAYAASKAGLHAMLRAVAEEHPAEQLRICQLIPTFQLVTPGIRRRRAPDHDFSSYGDPSILARVVSRLAATSGNLIPAGSFLVKPDGAIEEYRENIEFPR
jgi:NAD(P)-dependent dehydrogenase (short-subunit alcohol dehydrogenase family)